MNSDRKLRWGILGSASIAKGSVIPGLQQSELNEVAAIASRDEEKAKQTADQLGIPRLTAAMKHCSRMTPLTLYIFPFPTIFTGSGRSAQLRRANIFCARNHSR